MILNVEQAELTSYANAGLSSLSAVDVCALKEAKVTPAYLAATLKGGKFNVDDVRLMRMQKVPEDFPAACANCGKNYNAQEIVNLAAYGVDAQGDSSLGQIALSVRGC